MAAHMPAKGFVYNPLLKLPRNGPCVCGATRENGLPKKYKDCHLPLMPRVISEEQLAKLKAK